jgi:hypothetical protein
MSDLKDAIGGFVLYRAVMSCLEPDRILYLGIRDAVFTALFEKLIGILLIESVNVNLLVFNPETERITQWIPYLTIDNYRRIIEEVLVPYTQIPYSYGVIECKTVFVLS